MAGIVHAIKDIFSSIFEFFGAVVSTAVGLVQNIFNLFLDILRSIFSSIGWVLENILDLLKGFIELILGKGSEFVELKTESPNEKR